jgi:glycosyltransferase involved in cell wall biosynthesis
MRVLRIWHAAVVPEYRKKIFHLSKMPNVVLTLLVPPCWREGGSDVLYQSQDEIDTSFETQIGKTLNTNNIRRYIFRTQLFNCMRTLQPDIIDLEEEPFSFVAAQVLLFRGILNLDSRLIFHSAHNIERKMEPIFEYIQNSTLRKSQAAIVRNKEAGERLLKRGFGGPIIYSANGVDLTYFSPGNSSNLAKKLGIAGKETVGFVGKLKSGKGILTLLRAFQQLHKDTILIIVGEGHLKEEIQTFINTNKLENNVMLTGPLSHKTMPEYYRLMDVCVLPSETKMHWKESFGRTLVEAMACGIPVIGSSSGAIPDTIGNAGLIFPEGDSNSLMALIRKVLKDKDLRTQLREAGLARAQEFSWEKIAQKNHQAYLEVMKKYSESNS